jgi:hypothetical protein
VGACASIEPVLEERTYAPPGAALERVVVIPFYTHRTYQDSRLLGGVPAKVASGRVTRMVTDAMLERGIAVVPADEVEAAIGDVPRSTAAIDALIIANLAGSELGATGVLVGEILRFREVRGASETTRRPASVAFQVTFYEAPDGFKLWTARFEETQSVPAEDPGSETQGVEVRPRLLGAGEIAERGASAVARSLAASR